jgi:hypothetical protein
LPTDELLRELPYSALNLSLSSAYSLAFSSSDFSFGATCCKGAKLLTSNKNEVLIPDKFFKMNF